MSGIPILDEWALDLRFQQELGKSIDAVNVAVDHHNTNLKWRDSIARQLEAVEAEIDQMHAEADELNGVSEIAWRSAMGMNESVMDIANHTYGLPPDKLAMSPIQKAVLGHTIRATCERRYRAERKKLLGNEQVVAPLREYDTQYSASYADNVLGRLDAGHGLAASEAEALRRNKAGRQHLEISNEHSPIEHRILEDGLPADVAP